MLVDGHAHVIHQDWYGEPWWQGVSRLGASILGVPAEAIRENVLPAYFDEDGSAQLGAMDEGGVDLAAVLAQDWTTEEHLGRAPVGWREQNEWHADFAAKDPGRVRWAFGVDPRQEGAVAAFEEGVRDRGAMALKLHPSNGFALNDRVVYPIIERCGELDVPVVAHVGPEVTPLYSKWSEPILLDDLTADFPEVKFQAAHTGNAAWRQALAVASVKPNVYCDLSGWQTRFLRNPQRFYEDVREVVDTVGASRVMWGTDAPYYRALLPDGDWAKAFSEAPEGTFTADEVEAILGGTAIEFYGLTSSG
ncbi:MAG: amidohydrolase family protein [Actinomycetota bacterium]